jgi:hypothetical protein
MAGSASPGADAVVRPRDALERDTWLAGVIPNALTSLPRGLIVAADPHP